MEQLLTSEEKTFLSISFSQLKPACDLLITNPSKQHVNQLLKILSETPPEAIQKLTHYILLPIELHLRNESLKWEVKLYLLQCMKLVLQKSTLDDIKKIQNLYSLLFLLISKEEGLDKLYMTSEEFLIEVLECVTTLMRSLGVAEFYQMSMHPQLSFGVYKCVLIIKNVKASLVQSKAFNCLLTLTQTHDECQSKPNKKELVDLIKKMLPGIVSCCSHAVSVGVLQHHSVTMGAVRTWNKVICLVMKDEDTSDKNISIEAVRAVWEDKVVTKPFDDWTSMADVKLKSSTDIIMAARNHPHWRARLEVSCACRDVLSTCRRTMPSSVNAMLETLIILSQDEMVEVSLPASQTLKHLFESDEHFQLENLLQENLFELLQRLSCIIDSNDETKQVSDFYLLKGYLLCIGKQRLTQLLMTNVYLEQLFSSLTTIVELETSHVSLLDNDFNKDFGNTEYESSTPWKLLRHFTDTKLMLSRVYDVCRVLAACCDVRILIQYLLDMFETQVPNRKEICIVLSFILQHAHFVDSDVKLSMIKSVIESVLHGKVWHAPLSLHVRSEYTGHVADSIAQARSNIVLACLLCEVLGATAQCVAGPAFKQCLFQCLYVLMERAGSQHEYISQAGLQAIQHIVQACQYTNTAHLIADNIDYLSYHITIQLRQETPLVLDAIKVVLQQANDRLLPSIEDILDHVLRKGPSMFIDENKKLSHLNMYLIFVTMIRQWYCNLNPVLGQTDTPVDYVQDLLEFERIKNISEDYEQEEEGDNQYENIPKEEESPQEESPPPAPKYISMVEAILNTCLHFLPSRTLSHQVLVLQIINKGIQILASYNEDVLLPLVHKVWSALVSRLQDTAHPLVLNHSFNLLLTLAITSKDFIRSRTIKKQLLNYFVK
uniref:TELO2-interacting protein 1 homolog n=1 Tax=Cacopsylla melanoneura TaxID=428564 RepID=A0A8D9F7R6_9HEMI